MRLLIALTLLLAALPTICLSDQVRCYAHGKRVYDRHVHDIQYFDGVLSFTEDAGDNVVFTTMDCLVKLEV